MFTVFWFNKQNEFEKLLRADPLNELLRQQLPLKVSNQWYPLSLSKAKISSVANPDPGSGIRAPVPFWPLDLGSGIQDQDRGWVKSQDPDPRSGMRIRDPGPGMEKIRIRDQGSRMEKIWIQNLGFGMEKNRIRDPGSGINIPDQQNWKSRRQIC